jgi:hypothetical protein
MLTPGDGRRFPEGTPANDLWHWQVIPMTADLAAAAARCDVLVSPVPSTCPKMTLASVKG